MKGKRNNNAASIFGDRYIMTAKINNEGELELFPNQLLIV